MILQNIRRGLKASRSGRPLDPPATPAELDWWSTAKIPIRRRDFLRGGLVVQLPIWLGSVIHVGVDKLRSPSHLIYTLVIGLVMAGLTGWGSWTNMRKLKMRSAIIGKRLREGILNSPNPDGHTGESA